MQDFLSLNVYMAIWCQVYREAFEKKVQSLSTSILSSRDVSLSPSKSRATSVSSKPASSNRARARIFKANLPQSPVKQTNAAQIRNQVKGQQKGEHNQQETFVQASKQQKQPPTQKNQNKAIKRDSSKPKYKCNIKQQQSKLKQNIRWIILKQHCSKMNRQ